MAMTPFNPSRRQLLAMIGQVAGTAAMYQAMTSLGLAQESGYTGPPDLQGPRQGRRVLILGAGIAGMAAAYEMRRAGYEVKILEYQNRQGGRCLTIRGGDRYTEMGGHEISCDFQGDGYFNPGPWRLPVHHRAVFAYCRRLGVPMQPFINKNNKAYLHSAHAFGGQPQRIGHVEKDMRGHVSELLAKSLRQGELDEAVSPEDREKLLEGLKEWGVLDRNYRFSVSDDLGDVRGWDTRPGGGLMPEKSPSQPIDLSPLLQSGLWDQLFNFNGYQFEPPMFEPVGGMDRITDAFAREVADVIQLNARVTRIAQNDNSVTVTYEDGGQGGTVRQESADWCICTIPLSVLVQLDVDCSDAMRKAIAAVPYASAFKVALEFRRRFWEQDDWIMGGISYTDLPLVQIAYPNYGFLSDGPAVLQAAYDTATAGRNFTYSWSSMTPQERIDAALALGRQIHPQYDAEFMSGTSWVWHRVDWSLGCYGQWTEDLRDEHYQTLCEIDNRLVLAGEHCSHIPAWLEGSLLSALDAIRRLDQRENA
ncbi:flavin monoamine oxidase family protein [Roseinatronobacter alkalisoli]|uniref:Tryptophan 2-monooxygenase n=1 Tax=Roseinatronobacter alkalisoli TaxID=3028235 RepID=A0ABT5TCC2_9RHOB|nr:flavin monoamine oxidase family protein [Roseinatronobacter sp. HJB301]MDD7972777.1 flavin monoamine oxidase family protein [Roseinatronobacter sp. HJB301]